MTDSVSQIALAAAIDNEAKARAKSEAAALAVRAEKADRDALIEAAAAGKPVLAADVRKAEGATREAEIAAEIAAKVHGVAKKKKHDAEIDAWHAEAAAIDSEIAEAEAVRVKAGAVVDDAFLVLKEAVKQFNATGDSLWNARSAAGIFNSRNRDRKAKNPVLSATEQGEEPMARGNHKIGQPRPPEINPVEAMVYYRNAEAEFRHHVGSLASREANAFRRPDLLLAAN